MKVFPGVVILFSGLLAACSTSSQNREGLVGVIDSTLINPRYQWKLTSPEPGTNCDLRLSFSENNRMILQYRDAEYEGYYEIDSILTNYITINIFNKMGWDETCEVNPDYLSLYDNNTQFSDQVLNSRLYFERNEKVIIFNRVYLD